MAFWAIQGQLALAPLALASLRLPLASVESAASLALPSEAKPRFAKDQQLGLFWRAVARAYRLDSPALNPIDINRSKCQHLIHKITVFFLEITGSIRPPVSLRLSSAATWHLAWRPGLGMPPVKMGEDGSKRFRKMANLAK